MIFIYMDLLVFFAVRCNDLLTDKLKGKMGKAILTISRGGPWDCETSRLPYLLDNRLKDGGLDC
jgi:hypothetical protein